MFLLCLHHYLSNMYYASFMLTLDYDEELNEEYDDMSCMTRDTVTGRTLYRHAVDDSKSESNIKRSAAATRHLQNYMDRIGHEPSKWEDLEHCYMTHEFWGNFGTYTGKHAKNKNFFSIHPKQKHKNRRYENKKGSE